MMGTEELKQFLRLEDKIEGGTLIRLFILVVLSGSDHFLKV